MRHSTDRPSSDRAPLAGIKVLDLSRILAGPYCTQMLADMGATVWKIESPDGDDTRKWGPPFHEGEGAYFLSTNRGKKSVVINLKDKRGQKLVLQLAKRADVVVENFKAGDLARYGLDYESVSAVNPAVVYASITGYGQNGSMSSQPGYDLVIQALSGGMSITGDEAGPPTKVGVAWIDVHAGTTMATGIVAALFEREKSGLGQHLDVALFDVALASLVNQAQAWLMTGISPTRRGNSHPQIVPYEAFDANDGMFVVAVGNDVQYQRCCEALGVSEMRHERFLTNESRVANRIELVRMLQRLFRTKPRAHWIDLLRRSQVPVGPVNTIGEALQDSQVHYRGMLLDLVHPTLGHIKTVGSPLRHFSRTPLVAGGTPPLLGEHSKEVLREVLGLSSIEVEKLTRDSVIG